MTTPRPRLATGVEPLGPMAGSGYRTPPHLVRRGDGQVTQLSPLLAAIVAAIDGRRDVAGITERVEETHGRALHPDDVGHLIEAKLRPLGLLALPDGSEPVVRRTDPLLGLRGRLVVTSPERTGRITRPFVWLFRPPVVAAVLTLFAAVSTWVLLSHGLGTAVEDAMADPGLLLLLIGLILASGAFHEIGHAAACRYGGAAPGVMGAAVYLVWPAFYTDVTDSYRLDRAGRLRVDLGGLYFNAVFTVGTAAVWAATGVEALLLLIPVQLLQMARQLVPIVRFDGYHILADLVGVPDLFARIRPTVARAVPWRRDPTPNPLTPKAQAVVVTWVALVVPLLVASFGLLVWNLPGIVATALRSLDAQSELFRDNLDGGHFAAAVLGAVAMTTVAFLPLSAAYLSVRLARRSGARLWAATEEHPGLRAAALCAMVGIAMAAGPGLLPDGGTGTDVAGASEGPGGGGVVELALSPAAVPLEPLERATSPDPPEDPAVAEPRPAESILAAETSTPAPSGETAAASTSPAPTTAPSGGPGTWTFPFERPAAPGAGDNQALAFTTRDGGRQFDMATSLDWVGDGAMHNANEAWALADCTDCSARAVAFQIVVATTPTATAVPENTAVAYNDDACDRCRTTAIAVQVAVTLDGEPSPRARAELQQIVSSLRGRQGAFRTADPADIRAELRAARSRALVLLEPWVVDDESSEDTTETEEPTPIPDEADEPDGSDADGQTGDTGDTSDTSGTDDTAGEDGTVEEGAEGSGSTTTTTEGESADDPATSDTSTSETTTTTTEPTDDGTDDGTTDTTTEEPATGT